MTRMHVAWVGAQEINAQTHVRYKHACECTCVNGMYLHGMSMYGTHADAFVNAIVQSGSCTNLWGNLGSA